MTTAPTYGGTHDHHMSADERSSALERTQWIRRTSWGAILAGAVSAIGLQALFTVLGAALGLTAFGGEGGGADDMGMFAGIWWVLSGTVSLLVGGMIAGRMISIPRNAELVVHGFTMWAVTAIFGFLFIWSSAGMVGNVGSQAVESTSLIEQASQAMGSDSAAMQRDSVAQGSSMTVAQSSAAEEVQETAGAASWWTLLALLMGVAAAVGGTFIGAAPLGPQDRDHSD